MPGNLGGHRRVPDLPVFETRIRVSLTMVLAGWVGRLIGRAVAGLIRHWRAVLVVLAVIVVGQDAGPAGLGVLTVAAVVVAVVWRLVHRQSFAWAAERVYGQWRLWTRYAWRWRNTTIETGLAIRHPRSWGERVAYAEYVPTIRAVRSTRWTDSLRVELLYGQTPDDWADAADALRHVFRALRCQVRQEPSGFIWLDFQRRDPLVGIVHPGPLQTPVDLACLPVGRREDGRTWRLPLLDTHILVAGATGSGKASVLWSTIRALAPAVHAGTVELWVADPKGGMELAFGQGLFTRFAVDIPSIAEMLDDAVFTMRRRAAELRGVTRLHRPTPGDPLIVVIVDELASLTAYVADRDLKRRLAASLPLLLSQGRAPGVVVVGAVQDPRKEILPFRDLFPTRVLLRVTEAEQVDLVLGPGARDRGAHADTIPDRLPGVGYVLTDGQAEPVRVRATWIDDEEIAWISARYTTPLIGTIQTGGWTPDVNGGHAA